MFVANGGEQNQDYMTSSNSAFIIHDGVLDLTVYIPYVALAHTLSDIEAGLKDLDN